MPDWVEEGSDSAAAEQSKRRARCGRAELRLPGLVLSDSLLPRAAAVMRVEHVSCGSRRSQRGEWARARQDREGRVD